MKKRSLILSVLLLFGCTSNFKIWKSEPDVRVRIINTLNTLEISFNDEWILNYDDDIKEFNQSSGPVKLTVSDNKISLTHDNNTQSLDTETLVLRCKNFSGTLNIQDVPYGVGWSWEGKQQRTYEGELSVYINNENQFDVVVKLPLETYLKGVVPYEIGPNSPLEALKSQAVAARSEAVIALNSKMYSGDHYDLTSDVECQVFSGNHRRSENSDKAVEETKSLILSEKGKPINAYYASNCGGHSEIIKNVWPDRDRPKSYLTSGVDSDQNAKIDLSTEENARKWIESSPDVFCNPSGNSDFPEWSSRNFRWQKEYTPDELTKMLSQGNDYGQFLEFKPINRGVSGRICEAEFVFENKTVRKNTELSIRQMWAPSLLSACIVMDKSEGRFIIKGAGFGHGVGLCQTGAIVQAQQGKTFRQILNHYYRKAKIISVY